MTVQVYVTKHALTRGILLVEAEDYGDGMVSIRFPGSGQEYYYHGEGREWHRTLYSAKKRAFEMRDKAIESAEKKINRLRKLSFETAREV